MGASAELKMVGVQMLVASALNEQLVVRPSCHLLLVQVAFQVNPHLLFPSIKPFKVFLLKLPKSVVILLFLDFFELSLVNVVVLVLFHGEFGLSDDERGGVIAEVGGADSILSQHLPIFFQVSINPRIFMINRCIFVPHNSSAVLTPINVFSELEINVVNSWD